MSCTVCNLTVNRRGLYFWACFRALKIKRSILYDLFYQNFIDAAFLFVHLCVFKFTLIPYNKKKYTQCHYNLKICRIFNNLPRIHVDQVIQVFPLVPDNQEVLSFPVKQVNLNKMFCQTYNFNNRETLQL